MFYHLDYIVQGAEAVTVYEGTKTSLSVYYTNH